MRTPGFRADRSHDAGGQAAIALRVRLGHPPREKDRDAWMAKDATTENRCSNRAVWRQRAVAMRDEAAAVRDGD